LGEAEVRVCRVETSTSFGTGFLVGPNLVMTNYHVVADVLEDRQSVRDVVFRFDYRLLADGTTLNPGTEFRLHDSAWRVDDSPYSPEGPDELDYALLRLDDSPGTMPINFNEPGGQARGWFNVPTNSVCLKPGDPLHILQHPDARPLELALDTEAIIGISANRTRVRYRTNTQRGSSGSPCFDAEWNLVALHHGGDPSYGDLSEKGDWNQGVLFDVIVRRLNEQKVGYLLNQPLPLT
jgi:V8-like Glu-specific endopeptidase